MPDDFGVVLLGVASGLEVLGQNFPVATVFCMFASACMPDGCGDKIAVAMERAHEKISALGLCLVCWQK